MKRAEKSIIDLSKLSKRQRKLIIIVGISLILVGSVFLFLYCNGYSGLHNNKKARDGQIKVACVGDSITYGHGIEWWASNNYPAQLQRILGDEYNVANFGHSGRTISDSGDQPYTESKQYEKSLEYGADILVLMLGTNDTKPENLISILDLMSEYDALIESYKATNPQMRIILCTPSQAFFSGGKTQGKTNFDIQPEHLTAIRNSIRTYGLTNGYEVIDIYDLTQYHPEWFEKDNVHPSNEGAMAIARAVADKIK